MTVSPGSISIITLCPFVYLVCRLSWTLSGVLKQAAISLRISECILSQDVFALKQGNETMKGDYLDCPVVWDGTDACCKKPIEFSITLQAECHERFPYIRNAELLPVNVTSILIQEKILGMFPVTVADVTQAVKDRITQLLRRYIDPENRWIHWTQGQNFSFVGFLNRMLHVNAPAGIVCPGERDRADRVIRHFFYLIEATGSPGDHSIETHNP